MLVGCSELSAQKASYDMHGGCTSSQSCGIISFFFRDAKNFSSKSEMFGCFILNLGYIVLSIFPGLREKVPDADAAGVAGKEGRRAETAAALAYTLYRTQTHVFYCWANTNWISSARLWSANNGLVSKSIATGSPGDVACFERLKRGARVAFCKRRHWRSWLRGWPARLGAATVWRKSIVNGTNESWSPPWMGSGLQEEYHHHHNLVYSKMFIIKYENF